MQDSVAPIRSLFVTVFVGNYSAADSTIAPQFAIKAGVFPALIWFQCHVDVQG